MYTMPLSNRSNPRSNFEKASKSKKRPKRARTRNTRRNRDSDKITAGSGKKLDAKRGHGKYSALQKACMKPRVDLREIQRMIAYIESKKIAKAEVVEDNIAVFNQHSTPGNRHEESYRQVTKAMEALIAEAEECKKKLNYQDGRFGETALHLLCKRDKNRYTKDTVDAVNCLLTAGADPTIRRFATVSKFPKSNDCTTAIDLVRKHINEIEYHGHFDGMPERRQDWDLKKYEDSLKNLKEILTLLVSAKDRRLNIRDGNFYEHKEFVEAYSKLDTIAERAWRDQETHPGEAPQTPVPEGRPSERKQQTPVPEERPSKRTQRKRRKNQMGVTQVKASTTTMDDSKTTLVKASKRKQKRPNSRRRKTHKEV